MFDQQRDHLWVLTSFRLSNHRKDQSTETALLKVRYDLHANE